MALTALHRQCLVRVNKRIVNEIVISSVWSCKVKHKSFGRERATSKANSKPVASAASATDWNVPQKIARNKQPAGSIDCLRLPDIVKTGEIAKYSLTVQVLPIYVQQNLEIVFCVDCVNCCHGNSEFVVFAGFFSHGFKPRFVAVAGRGDY